jgi:hypothetical protein
MALADRQLAAGTVREEDLEAVHHTVREEVQEARRTGQEDLEVVRRIGLGVARRVQCDVAEAAGSPAEDGHRIGRVEDLEEEHRSLLGTAGLVEGRSQVDRSLAVGVEEEAGHSLVEEEVGRSRLEEAEGHRRRSSQTCCSLLMLFSGVESDGVVAK